jgi:microcystin-dependent protein
MTDQYVGQVQLFGFNFAPNGWALCQGQILPIQQYSALFALIGSAYGGNGASNFALPNLQGRSAVGVGQGPSLTNYVQGQTAGEVSVTLGISTMPSHNHSFFAASAAGTTTTAAGQQLGVSQIGKGTGKEVTTYTAAIYSPNPGNATTGLTPQAVGLAGNTQPHNNMQPYLALNYCIALIGEFPPRN